MTTLYRPIRIETAEQAEALPDGTVAIDNRDGTTHSASLKTARGWEQTGGYPEPMTPDRDEWMIGDTALVPIEAEEEYSTERAGLAWDNDAIYSSPEDVRRDGWTDPLQRRLVTPWESA